MKKWFFLFLGFSVFFFSCKKDSKTACTAKESTTVAPAAEIDSINRYLTSNSLTATQVPTGVFYRIDSTGTGKLPGICSALAVKYSGYFMGNPVPFETFTTEGGTIFTLSDVIAGWQNVMQLVKQGSKVTLYIPPTLAYGDVDKRNADGDITIPRKSYLVFNIELITVY